MRLPSFCFVFQSVSLFCEFACATIFGYFFLFFFLHLYLCCIETNSIFICKFIKQQPEDEEKVIFVRGFAEDLKITFSESEELFVPRIRKRWIVLCIFV